MTDAHDFYESINATIVSGCMTATLSKKGEWKKTFTFPDGWQKTTNKKYSKIYNGYAMLMGERHGMIAIDIDDPTLPCAEELINLMNSCNMVQQTKKGYHYVFKYTSILKQTTGTDSTKIDIRSDGGCIFCEPSTCKNPDGDVVASYEWIKQPFEDEELVEVPQQVIDYLTKLDRRYIGVEEPKKIRKPISETSSVETDPKEDTKEEMDTGLVKVIHALDAKFFDAYDDWVKIGMICYNEGLPLELWDEVSKKSSAYEAGACKKKWDTFGKNDGRKLTGATLWKALKLSNPSAFWSLMPERKDFWNTIELLNHKDIAKYFYNVNPDNYLWDEAMGWYLLTSGNIWKHSEKGMPSGLKRHVADTMQELAIETKKAELATYTSKASETTNPDEQKLLTKKHVEKMGKINEAYKKFGTSEFCNGVIAFLPSFYEKEGLQDIMDMNRTVFAFTDGLFDLTECKFRPIVPTDYISTTTGYPYPKSSSPTIRSALKKFLFGLFEDKKTEEYLCNVLASCLFGGNRWEEFYVFTGSGGNGKGVISELLMNSFGEYYYSVDNTLFTKPADRKESPSPVLVAARCKRIMMTTEPESDDKLQSGLIKKISGNDIIEATAKYSNNVIRYVPQFKLILQTNNIPKLNRIDGGVERRMRIINFPFKFVSADKMGEEEKNNRLGDPDVKDIHCKSEAWRNEFMLMMTEIYATIKSLKSLPTPSSVAEATGNYMDDNNPLKTWLAKYYHITTNESDQILASEMKRSFIEDNRLEKFGDGTFKNLMIFNGIKWKHTNAGNAYLCIKRKTFEELNPCLVKDE